MKVQTHLTIWKDGHQRWYNSHHNGRNFLSNLQYIPHHCQSIVDNITEMKSVVAVKLKENKSQGIKLEEISKEYWTREKNEATRKHKRKEEKFTMLGKPKIYVHSWRWVYLCGTHNVKKVMHNKYRLSWVPWQPLHQWPNTHCWQLKHFL